MITALISTVGPRIKNLSLPPLHPNVRYVVVQQSFNGFFESLPSVLLNRSDVKLIRCDRLGLSVSRNLGIQNIETDYCQIYDDDVAIDLQHLLSLPGLFHIFGAQVITGSFQFSNGNLPKIYKDSPFRRNLLSCMQVSSVEIAFDVSFIRKNGILFNEQFGLGAKYPSGEEFIFLSNLIRIGAEVWFIPSSTCIHPPMTSGLSFYKNDKSIVAKRSMFKEVFGTLGFFFTVLFALKKAPLVCLNGGNYFRFLKVLFFGKN